MQTSAGVVGSSHIRTYTGPAGTTYGLALIQGATDGAVILPTGANMACLGINSETDVANSGVLGVVTGGETVAIAGAAVAAGGYLTADATGKLIPSTAIGDQVIAQAITSAVNAGDEIIVQVTKFIR